MAASSAKSPSGVIQELTDILEEKASELRGIARRRGAAVVDSESSDSSPILQRKKKSRFSAKSTPLRSSSDGKLLEP